ncbi:hypothetical protein EIN_230660 [Entamoeba invadens IP1]|uniref:Uncharacterized protein n=1 Tax=Entamoeba invadens IP1 TaxID=370355 RepID=A0A0A1U910_ENTIV|nr:hypothetical protein EIN_230660 [Entamoeba invadens IP1]ELP88473.1 hypothetical protein EIN_230660 [Entamoeba invadens IP1]|eukprot:XP_004255244.1 hypothetical protein EIN_230660 [Entamoeba invadens IP1]
MRLLSVRIFKTKVLEVIKKGDALAKQAATIDLQNVRQMEHLIHRHITLVERELAFDLTKLSQQMLRRVKKLKDKYLDSVYASALMKNTYQMDVLKRKIFNLNAFLKCAPILEKAESYNHTLSLLKNDNMTFSVRDYDSVEQTHLKQEWKFNKIVVDETKALNRELQNLFKRRELLKIAFKLGKRVIEELDIANNDVRLVEKGIESIRREVQESVLESETIYSLLLARGMALRSTFLSSLIQFVQSQKSAILSKLPKRDYERLMAELHFIKADQIVGNLNQIRNKNLRFVQFGLKEIQIAQLELKECERTRDPLTANVINTIGEWNQTVNKGIIRVRKSKRPTYSLKTKMNSVLYVLMWTANSSCVVAREKFGGNWASVAKQV